MHASMTKDDRKHAYLHYCRVTLILRITTRRYFLFNQRPTKFCFEIYCRHTGKRTLDMSSVLDTFSRADDDRIQKSSIASVSRPNKEH